MKPAVQNRQQAGSTLMVTLVMGITIGITLGAYLALIGNRYELTMRSQCWNNAVPVLEAGIEEALTHLNDDFQSPAANGWTNGTVGGQNIYAKQRTFSDGSAYYTVIYNAGAPSPYIYSTALIPAPRHRDTSISRTVRVTGYSPPLINAAFAAVYSIKLNGSSMASDSFNSALTNLSNNGLYDPTRTSTNGSVASVYGPVSFGQHAIQGNLYLGPAVTDSSVTAGQVSGQIYTDFNVSYPDAILPIPPSPGWQSPPAKTTIGKDQFYDFTTSGYYLVSDSAGIIVEPGVDVKLQVTTADFLPSTIHIMGDTNGVSGTLSIYQLSGKGTLNSVVMDIPRARNLWYFGLPGVTSIAYGGTTTFVGVIYAPEADLSLNGGGSGDGLIGAVVAKSISMNGNNYVSHFDEDLMTAGPRRGMVVTNWQEL